MKSKILNLLLILTSLFGFLEWGKGNKQFLFQLEKEIILKIFSEPASVIHPFTILPLTGQLLLLITLFQRNPGRILTYAGIGGIGVLLLMMFVIGLLSLDFKILLSTIPFLVIAVFTVIHHRRK
ncbi:MAG TPA: hypothetical protein VE978_09715 [Chitinophagales bacterium]|nr:hypothetical protein [Chitinophagales bacterium]